MNTTFRFKQFEIEHRDSAMKVGTDSVLLGAWAQFGNAKTILDVGAGTGILALMMAQRYPNSAITALEIEQLAFQEATYNITKSPFAQQVKAEHVAFQDYPVELKYDGIICNPPFFVDALKTSNAQRNLARHSDSLNMSELIEGVVGRLSPKGEFALILPYDQHTFFVEIANSKALFTHRIMHVRGGSDKPYKRTLLQLSFQSKMLETSHLDIELARHQYTQDYIDLVKDFYLKM